MRNLVAAMVFFSACGRVFRPLPEQPVVAAAGEISTFSLQPSQVTSGETVTANAHIVGASAKLQLSSGESLDIVSDSPLVFAPTMTGPLPSETRTATLVVIGEDGRTVTQSLALTVFTAPRTPLISASTWVSANTDGLTASVDTQLGMTYVWSLAPSGRQGGDITSQTAGDGIVYGVGDIGQVTLSCAARNALGVTSAAATADVMVVGVSQAAGTPTAIDGANVDMVVDEAGSFYLGGPIRLLKIVPNGITSTLAGPPLGTNTEACVDGTGSAARFNGLSAIVRDGKGILYILQSLDSAVRRIDTTGAVTTVSAPAASCGTVAIKVQASALAVTAAGVLFVGDATGAVWRVADPLTATSAASVALLGAAVSALAVSSNETALYAVVAGRLFVGQLSGAAYAMTAVGSTLPGADDGPLASASFSAISRLMVAADGALLVSDGDAIRKVAGGIVTTLAAPREIGRDPLVDVPPANGNWLPGLVSVGANGDLFVLGSILGGLARGIFQIRLPPP